MDSASSTIDVATLLESRKREILAFRSRRMRAARTLRNRRRMVWTLAMPSAVYAAAEHDRCSNPRREVLVRRRRNNWIAVASAALALAGCAAHRVVTVEPVTWDESFDQAISVYDRDVQRLPAASDASAPSVIAAALVHLAFAIDAIPDARAGDMPRFAAETVRACGERLANARHGAGTPDVKGALLVASAVIEHLAIAIYPDVAALRTMAMAFEIATNGVNDAMPIETQRQAIQSAFDASDVALDLIETAAAKSPFPPRERKRMTPHEGDPH
jgi:hypothetical protein